MKKKIKVLLLIAISFSLIGCKSNIDTSKNINYQEIEEANRESDVELLNKAKTLYDTNHKKCNTKIEKQVVTVKYFDDVYQIASNRVNLDLDILEVFSDEYVTYVATMQAYCEVYLQERSELINNSSLEDLSKIKDIKTGRMLETLLNMTNEVKK